MKFEAVDIPNHSITIALSTDEFRTVRELAIAICEPDRVHLFYPRNGIWKVGPRLFLVPQCPLFALVSPARGRLWLCRPCLNLWFDLYEWGDTTPLLWPEDAPDKYPHKFPQ